jgi:hypothetical protein
VTSRQLRYVDLVWLTYVASSTAYYFCSQNITKPCVEPTAMDGNGNCMCGVVNTDHIFLHKSMVALVDGTDNESYSGNKQSQQAHSCHWKYSNKIEKEI